MIRALYENRKSKISGLLTRLDDETRLAVNSDGPAGRGKSSTRRIPVSSTRWNVETRKKFLILAPSIRTEIN